MAHKTRLFEQWRERAHHSIDEAQDMLHERVKFIITEGHFAVVDFFLDLLRFEYVEQGKNNAATNVGLCNQAMAGVAALDELRRLFLDDASGLSEQLKQKEEALLEPWDKEHPLIERQIMGVGQ
jgi:hypothetical protein